MDVTAGIFFSSFLVGEDLGEGVSGLNEDHSAIDWL